MQLTINGETHALPDGMNVSGLLEHLALDTKKIAIERNHVIVPKSAYDGETLAEKDEIEIVGFIGGG